MQEAVNIKCYFPCLEEVARFSVSPVGLRACFRPRAGRLQGGRAWGALGPVFSGLRPGDWRAQLVRGQWSRGREGGWREARQQEQGQEGGWSKRSGSRSEGWKEARAKVREQNKM